MKLISCKYCGVVIDTDRLIKEICYDHDTGNILKDLCGWDEESLKYKPLIDCPACERRIFYHNGEMEKRR